MKTNPEHMQSDAARLRGRTCRRRALRIAAAAAALAIAIAAAVIVPGLLMPEFKVRGKADAETVVFIHGLQRTGFSMVRLERVFRNAGYRTVVCSYSSAYHIATISTNLFNGLAPLVADAPEVHFVTHSMGGIILRDGLARNALPNAAIGNAVMLAPPNRGAELIDKFADTPGFGAVWGAAGRGLRSGPDSVPARLPPVDFRCGVIAATRSASPLSLFIPGRDDGKVSISSTYAPGIAAHVSMPANHLLMTFFDSVGLETLHFIRNGRFSFDNATEPRR